MKPTRRRYDSKSMGTFVVVSHAFVRRARAFEIGSSSAVGVDRIPKRRQRLDQVVAKIRYTQYIAKEWRIMKEMMPIGVFRLDRRIYKVSRLEY
jgi:hypothetical protein